MPESNEQARRNAALGDLRKCLELAEEMGELEVIDGADPYLEMGALYTLSQSRKIPPILLFQKIQGYPDDYRVVVNVRASKLFVQGEGLELVQAYRKHRRKKSDPIPPEIVTTGPVLENIMLGDDVNVLKFPTPHWNKGDGGRYIIAATPMVQTGAWGRPPPHR